MAGLDVGLPSRIRRCCPEGGAATAAFAEPRYVGSPVHAHPLSGVRLLVVEDETLVAMMLEEMLTDLGCVVQAIAGTVSRGLRFAGDATLDLDAAVLDINIGGEMVYPIADTLLNRKVPFMFATAYGALGVAAGFADVPTLAKPYGAWGLETTLRSALGAGPPTSGQLPC